MTKLEEKLEEMLVLVRGGVTIRTATERVFGSYGRYRHGTSSVQRRQVLAIRVQVMEQQRAQFVEFRYSSSCHQAHFYLPNDKWDKVKIRAERQGVSVSKYLNGLVARDLQDA